MKSLEKACGYLATHAQPKSTGKCGTFIRTAVDFGFEKHIKKTLSAKDYGSSYEEIGFKKIFEYTGVNKKEYQPKLGDICIIDYEPHGHICMYNGKVWISDFVQRDMYGGKIRDKDPKFDIYRYDPANQRTAA